MQIREPAGAPVAARPGRHALNPSRGVAVACLLAGIAMEATASAQGKSFEEYLKPTPVTCSPLSSATWGVAGVLPRDTCNGIESAKGAGVPPDYYYWDGAIIRAKDQKYHLFMSTWAGSAGFNPGWTGSDAYHAISPTSVLGPYARQDYVYSNGGSHKGHNVSALELRDGTYAVVVSETVPFTIYKSSSLDGPWTGCQATIQTNGLSNCGDSHLDSNVSLVARPDGKFEIVQRHGIIALADTLCGPYTVQKPTWSYPTANRPSCDTSIYPKRTSIPGVSNPTFTWEEDPHIWWSAGMYHVIYSGSGDRVGWWVYSADGLTNWKDGGYAWSPRDYQKIFCYEGSTTCSQWYKMERPGVVLENGHPTHITWAVADVDKDNQIPAGSNHGSKVIVVPFDGATFDTDYGTGTTGGAGGSAGSGGVSGSAGSGGVSGAGSGGVSGSAGTGGVSGASGSGGAGSGGVSGSAGSGGASGTAGSGGTVGGASGAAGTSGAGGVLTGGSSGQSGSGGNVSAGQSGTGALGGGVGGSGASGGSAGTVSTGGGPAGSAGTGGSGNAAGAAPGSVEPDSASGCACRIERRSEGARGSLTLLFGLAALGAARRRSRRH